MSYPQAFLCVPTKKVINLALLLGKWYANSEVTIYDDIQITNITSYFYGYDGNTKEKSLFALSMNRQPSWRYFWSFVEKLLNLKELDSGN